MQIRGDPRGHLQFLILRSRNSEVTFHIPTKEKRPLPQLMSLDGTNGSCSRSLWWSIDNIYINGTPESKWNGDMLMWLRHRHITVVYLRPFRPLLRMCPIAKVAVIDYILVRFVGGQVGILGRYASTYVAAGEEANLESS